MEEVKVLISINDYNQLKEARHKVIDGLQEIISAMRTVLLEWQPKLGTDYNSQNYSELIRLLDKHRYKEWFGGFEKETGRVKINEEV